jgi:hypothetical protein
VFPELRGPFERISLRGTALKLQLAWPFKVESPAGENKLGEGKIRRGVGCCGAGTGTGTENPEFSERTESGDDLVWMLRKDFFLCRAGVAAEKLECLSG